MKATRCLTRSSVPGRPQSWQKNSAVTSPGSKKTKNIAGWQRKGWLWPKPRRPYKVTAAVYSGSATHTKNRTGRNSVHPQKEGSLVHHHYSFQHIHSTGKIEFARFFRRYLYRDD